MAADDADELLPFVASLLGLCPVGPHAERLRGIEGEALERLTFKSMRTLIQRLAQQRPLVLFFEDLHWADRSSVQLLELLLRLVTDSPILFVHAFRPAHVETGQRILDLARTQYPLQHRLIRLQPLDAVQATELVRNLLGAEEPAPSAVERITQQAEGNPLFVEEIVRALHDAGAIEVRDRRACAPDVGRRNRVRISARAGAGGRVRIDPGAGAAGPARARRWPGRCAGRDVMLGLLAGGVFRFSPSPRRERREPEGEL